jgi:hypothetical protein
MPWLFLDTHAPGQVRLGWLETGRRPQVATHATRAHQALNHLSEIWPRDPSKIAGVCVVAGPGSFSSVRSGVLDANLIARWLKVKLVGVSADEAEKLPVLSQRLATERGVSYVAPVYDREPNITQPKAV